MMAAVRRARISDPARPIIIYLATAIIGDLAWETSQLPLYTLWWSAAKGGNLWTVIHCTAGDALIAAAALGLALGVAWLGGWPIFGFRMMATAILAGTAYTVFSEWRNVEILHRWAYTAKMPLLPILGTGLAPALQWLIVPSIAVAVASRFCPKELNP